MSEETFTCAECGGTFPKAWTDAEALAERAENFPALQDRDAAVVCDICFRKLMPDGVLWQQLLERDQRELLFAAMDHLLEHQVREIDALRRIDEYVHDAGDQAAINVLEELRGEDPAIAERRARIAKLTEKEKASIQ